MTERTRGVTMETYQLDGAEREKPLIEDGETIEADILSEMNASEGDTTYFVRVNRVLGAAKSGAKEPFLFEGDAAITLPGIHVRLLEEYGSGTYRVRILKDKQLWKRFDVQVEKPAQIKPSADLSGMASLAQALRDMGQRQDQLFEKLLELRQTPPPAPAIAPVDTITLIERIASMMTTLRPPQPPGPDFNSLIEVFKSGIEMGGHSVGSSEKETGIYDLIQTFMQSPLLVAILEGMKNAGGVQPNPGNVIPLPQRPPVPQIQNNQSPQNSGVVVPRPPNGNPISQSPPAPSNDVMANVKNMLLFLNSRAAENSDTELYAEMLLDALPSELVPQFLAADGVFDQLKMIEPSVAQYKEWFTALLSNMREQAKEELGSNPQPGYVAPISS